MKAPQTNTRWYVIKKKTVSIHDTPLKGSLTSPPSSWWRHEMELFSTLLALCEGSNRWIPTQCRVSNTGFGVLSGVSLNSATNSGITGKFLIYVKWVIAGKRYVQILIRYRDKDGCTKSMLLRVPDELWFQRLVCFVEYSSVGTSSLCWAGESGRGWSWQAKNYGCKTYADSRGNWNSLWIIATFAWIKMIQFNKIYS